MKTLKGKKAAKRLNDLFLNKKTARKLDSLFVNGNDDNLTKLLEGIAGKIDRKQKIVIVGFLHFNKEVIYTIAGELGIDRKQIEIFDDYKKLKKKSFRHIQNNPRYIGILISQIPHHTKDTETYNSATTQMTKEQGFPPCEIIQNLSGKLKATKTSIKIALMHLLVRIGHKYLSPSTNIN